MLKRSKNKILAALLLLVTAVSAFLQFQDSAMFKERYQAVSIRMNKNGVTVQELESALKGETVRGTSDIPDIAAWNWCDKAEIEADKLSRSVTVTPVLVYGNMSLVSPMTVNRGNFVYSEDKQGCVIDSKTAYRLFGTVKAEGNTITYQKSCYYIRGVVQSKYPMFLIQAADAAVEYKNLELLYRNRERGEEFAQDFMYQNGLGIDFHTIDGYFYSRMIRTILSLPLWLFFLAVAVTMIKIYLQHKTHGIKPGYLVYGLIGLLVLTGYGIMMTGFAGSPIYFPEKLVPSKWSDFDYWSKQYANIKEQLLQMRLLAPNPKDILLTDELIKLPYRLVIQIILYAVLYLKLVFPFAVNYGRSSGSRH